MPELTPLDDNRQEHFLNGEDLEPITRREHFYASRESELPEGHQEPETREEWFIQKYRGGDVTVVPLSVTDNGTYSEEGKAYSPVSVNVPLPQNAYLLKSVANLPQAIASFNDGEEMVMPSLKVAIEPQQEGSGEPSPTNVRPISGWSEANVTRCGGNLYAKANNIIITKHIPNGTKVYTQIFGGTFAGASLYGKSNTTDWISLGTISQSKNVITINRDDIIELKISSSAYGDLIRGNSDLMVSFADFDAYEPYAGTTYTIDLDGTRYGGTLDVVSGVLTLTHVLADLPNLSWGKSTNTANIYFYALYTSGANGNYNEPATNVMSNIYIPKSRNSLTNIQGTVGISAEANALYIADGRFNDYTATQFKEAMSDVQLLLPLATPQTIQLTPTAVKSLLGQNNIWADTGDITDAEYFSKEV